MSDEFRQALAKWRKQEAAATPEQKAKLAADIDKLLALLRRKA